MLSRTIIRRTLFFRAGIGYMGISDFFKAKQKKPQEPGTGERADDLFEPVPETEPPKAPDPTIPVPNVTGYTLPELFEPVTETEFPMVAGSVAPVPEPEVAEPKKPESFIHRSLHLFGKKAKTAIEEYDFLKNGPLVAGELLPGYTLIDQYWIDEGQSLVYITLNNRTNQMEYLLFEPVLSNFEYELLERLHEDLRDILILTSDEIKKTVRSSCSIKP